LIEPRVGGTGKKPCRQSLISSMRGSRSDVKGQKRYKFFRSKGARRATLGDFVHPFVRSPFCCQKAMQRTSAFVVYSQLWLRKVRDLRGPLGIRWVLPGDEPMRGERARDSSTDRVRNEGCTGLQGRRFAARRTRLVANCLDGILREK
jgi:hypothetical protein